jgi:hypothetical protein
MNTPAHKKTLYYNTFAKQTKGRHISYLNKGQLHTTVSNALSINLLPQQAEIRIPSEGN